MAMSVTYATFDGVLVYENRGGVETEYTSDTLGNLIECHGPDGVSTYTADYWPYGGVRTSTGTNPSPWGFVGLLGYYTDALNFLYVRARYYRPNLTRWQTVDPLWPSESAYGYCDAAPTLESDPSGELAICVHRSFCDRCRDRYGKMPSKSCSPAYLQAIEDATMKYCKKTCPNLTPHKFVCQMFAESNCDPRAITGDNRGLFQISPDIWRIYGCNVFGPYFPNVWNPIKNIECAIKAMCKFNASHHGGFHCRQSKEGGGWGTHTEHNSMYGCCISCS